MSRKTQTSKWGPLLLGIAVVAPVAMASAIAAPPMTGLPTGARLVSDEELGDMRGRYIAPRANEFLRYPDGIHVADRRRQRAHCIA